MSTPDSTRPCCNPSKIASPASWQYKFTARIASSFPGMGNAISDGSELLSTMATTGIPSVFASAIAMCSLTVSITKSRSGTPAISLIPPSVRSSLSRVRVRSSCSRLLRPAPSSSPSSSELSSFNRLMDWLIVDQLVNIPPSHLSLTKY